MIRCSRAQRWILVARDGELGLARRTRLDEHLAACADCRALDAADARLEEALARWPEPNAGAVDLEAQVRAIAARIDAAPRPRRPSRRPQALFALAACAALALALAWVFANRRAPPPRHVDVAPGSPLAMGTVDRAFAPPEPEPEPDSDSGPGPGPDAIERTVPERGEGPELDPSGAAIDVERLAAARERARRALTADAADLDALHAEGWPVVRLVERCTADDDPDVAGAAARWLGAHGDRLSVRPLSALLARARAATTRAAAGAALSALGSEAWSALGPALDDPELRPTALASLSAATPEQAPLAVTQIELALGRARSASDADELAAALIAFGERGVSCLLGVAGSQEIDGIPRERALAGLKLARSTEQVVASMFAKRPRRGAPDEAAVLEAATALGLECALPVLEERARERATRDGALALLARFEGPGSLVSLTRLWRERRVPENDVVAAAHTALAHDEDIAAEAIDVLRAQGDASGLRALAEICLVVDGVVADLALTRLVACASLSDEERAWCALGLIGRGDARAAERLGRELALLSPAQVRLAAACALALYDGGGAQALCDALRGEGRADDLGADATSAEETCTELSDLFARRSTERNQVLTLSRASRVLLPWLESIERTRHHP